MKKLSITMRISIWYATFMIIIAAILIISALAVFRYHERTEIKVNLMEEVADISEQIEAVGRKFVLNDDIRFLNNGVYLSAYVTAGDLVEGKRPASIADFPDFKDKEMTVVKDRNGETWYVYDSYFNLGTRNIWARGIAKEDILGVDNTTARLVLLGFIIFVVVVANFGGYRIAKRAYSPVDNIINTVENIRDNADLSKRLELGDNQDELYRLSYTFNQMIERIETDMIREKQFTSDVSHELKTPISVINYQSKYAMEDPSYQSEAIQSIYEESERMAGIVNNLLTLSRSDEGRLKIEHESVNLSLICEGIAEQQNLVLSEQGIEIQTDISEEVYVDGDEIMLVRMLLNLIDNAGKYGCDNEKLIELKLSAACDTAVLTVRDFGRGMSRDVLARIWDRFYRADQSRTDVNSTGLGLPIVKAVVEAHGGTIEAESEENRGTVFTVHLPRRNRNEENV